jgi:hypothetical protein
VSTLIKSGRRIRENFILLICTSLAVVVVWRGVIIGDLMAAWMCIALGVCLVFTGIALVDYRKSTLASDNA